MTSTISVLFLIRHILLFAGKWPGCGVTATRPIFLQPGQRSA